MKNLAIFASGEGTNAERIIAYFKNSTRMRVVLIVYNRPTAGIAKRAERLGVPCRLLSKEDFADFSQLLPLLREFQVDFIVLDGFLLLLPEYLLDAFPQ